MPEGEAAVAFLLRYFFTHHRVERMAAKAQEELRGERDARHHPAESTREQDDRGDRGDRNGRDRDRRRSRDERPERAERPERPERTQGDAAPKAAAEPDPRGTKLWCNLGQADKVDAETLAVAVAEAAGVPRTLINAVDLRPTSAYLFVPPEAVEPLVAATGKEREGKKLRVEQARSRR